jgi:hypothetical protein
MCTVQKSTKFRQELEVLVLSGSRYCYRGDNLLFIRVTAAGVATLAHAV